MKRRFEIKALPGDELTFEEVEKFVGDVRGYGAGELNTIVKATVRMNGTLRALAVEIEVNDAPGPTPSTTR